MAHSDDPILIRRIESKNFLSFGPGNEGIDLKPLNVIIGPNGSGKSNLIEAIHFMRAAAKDFAGVTRKGGGVTEWIWKGGSDIKATNPSLRVGMPMRHRSRFQSAIHIASAGERSIVDGSPR